MWRLFNKPVPKLEQLLEEFYEDRLYLSADPEFLAKLVRVFRPESPEKDVSVKPLIAYLHQHDEVRRALRIHIQRVFQNKRFTSILTDSGILHDTHFRREVKSRLIAKILPEQPKKDTLQFVLNQILYRETDHEWIERIPVNELDEFLNLLELTTIFDNTEENSPITEIVNALSLLIQRISGRALEEDVLMMIPEYENVESPFEAFEKVLDKVVLKIMKSPHHAISKEDEDYEKMLELLASCNFIIDTAFNNSEKFGISLNVNQSLLRIRQQLDRIETILPVIIADNEEEQQKNSLYLAFKLIKYNCKKNNVRRLLKDSTQAIAYEVTQHTAKTGEHYITHSRKEYFQMLYTAMGGGLIVGFMVLFKVILGQADVSDLGHAVLYSLNYAFGFIMIYLLGFTLATKQPAMTAATIVKSIEEDMENSQDNLERHRSFVRLFSHLFRSQFIAFTGNVLVAFPVALLVIWFTDDFIGHDPVTPHKATVLLTDLSPIASAAIIHAGIAGIFLFLSGIISGSISNKLKFYKVYFRIKEHPGLKLTFGKQRTKELAYWVRQNWAGVASNFWFGVFMGSTSSVGKFIGLNLDIRHITFAAGNLALGIYGQHFQTPVSVIIWAVIGIGIIGFMNFIVSFTLSLALALRSRNIPFSEIRHLMHSVWRYFRKKPLAFFFPTKH